MTTPTATDAMLAMMNEAGAVQMQFTEGATGSLPADANRGLHAFDAARAAAQAAVNGAASRVAQLRADDTVPAASVARQVREHIAAARTVLTEKVSHLDAITTIVRGVLHSAALPKLTPGAELVARADAQMILDGARDKGAALARLATRQDDLGALVASGWGRDYLGRAWRR